MDGSSPCERSRTAAFAEGWYVVCWSADLGPRTVMPLRYFGENFVLFRGESGRPTLLDAHCPHLGAHLGYGGRIEGDEIVCPFHAWRFSAAGRCVDIPYASRIPPKAAIRSYPIAEHSGMILAYVGRRDASPSYEVPPIEELNDPAWTPLERSEITIATQAREVIENIADRAHFLPVHRQNVESLELIIDGPRATQRTRGRGGTLDGKPIPVETVATYHGPAVQFTRLLWAYDMVLINAHIPIDERRLLLRFGVILRIPEGATLSRDVVLQHVAAARDGYFQDVAIWEHKRWRDQPLLADGDGPIGDIRQWYQSFLAETPVSDER